MQCGTPLASPVCPIDLEATSQQLQEVWNACGEDQDCFYAYLQEVHDAQVKAAQEGAWLDPVAMGIGIAQGAKTGLKIAGTIGSGIKSIQMHHFLTNKHSKFTTDMEAIVKRYDLDLNGAWNKERLPQQGRHSVRYHEWALNGLRKIDRMADGDQRKFLHLFESEIKAKVRAHPEMLYSEYWR